MLALLPLIMLSTMPLSSNADEGVAFTFKDNICPTKPCANGGDCSFNAQVGSYTCFCHCGYRGANCTINPPGTCSEYSCGQRGKCVTESRKRGRLRQNTCTFTRANAILTGLFVEGMGDVKGSKATTATAATAIYQVLKKSSISSSENFLFNFAKILLGIILFGNPSFDLLELRFIFQPGAVFQLLYLLVDERLKTVCVFQNSGREEKQWEPEFLCEFLPQNLAQKHILSITKKSLSYQISLRAFESHTDVEYRADAAIYTRSDFDLAVHSIAIE
eukprot:jgi/Bigna1/130585/aug1.11_g5293